MEEIEKTPEKQPEKRLPATCTVTARIDRDCYKRLQTESETRNLPVSTYAASMIKECWQLRETANMLKQPVENAENAALPQPEPEPNANRMKQIAANLDAALAKETALSLKLHNALTYLSGKHPNYTPEQLMAACILNVFENETALLFVTELKHTLKTMPHEA
ncbi:hypothetical protein C7N43_34510 [Sphingobacteriales bacterium UPWRP_1]|nr:hypothetical protein C7N43_34510 [Sphingobacteriales bacterium UPWRP_1]